MSEAEKKALRKNVRNGYSIFQISAMLKNEETAELKQLVDGADLREFSPRASDIKKRQKLVLDDCTPTLVIIWSDKWMVFKLPHSDEVREDVPADRLRAYKKMSEVCTAVLRLNDRYGRKPYVKAVAVHGSEYQAFEKERDRLTDAVR